ncbi:MAG: hypothetical protein WC389_17445 [Lutibacter sp.]
MDEEIKNNPEKVISDEEMLKEIIPNPEKVINLLKNLGVGHKDVEVDGEKIALVRPLE